MSLDASARVVRLSADNTWRQAEARAASAGCTLGPVPVWLADRTVGETLAQNDRRRPSPAYGELLDAILSVEATLPDGQPTRSAIAPRRATGPDLARAVIGMQGRVGHIQAVHVQAWPAVRARAWRARRFDDWAAALAAAQRVLEAGAEPAWWRIARIRGAVLLWAGLHTAIDLPRLAANFDAVVGGRAADVGKVEAFEREVFQGRTADRFVVGLAAPSALAGLAEATRGAEIWDVRRAGGAVWQRRPTPTLAPDPAWAALEAAFAARVGGA